jgi:hypothetical protein
VGDGEFACRLERMVRCLKPKVEVGAFGIGDPSGMALVDLVCLGRREWEWSVSQQSLTE